ncbi:MAG: endonuclease III [Candidatus Micrarchaeota archaeon]
MANKRALERMGWMLDQMEKEARKRDAPVFRAEDSTKDTPFTILVFTMLSARTKDSATTDAVARLFKKAKTPGQIASLGARELEELLYGVGFYRVKAKNLIAISKAIDGLGAVPDTLEGLMSLPGVGRKTANIVLARAFGKNTLGVDVHVHRISNRLGMVKTKKPEETERALLRIVPERYIRSLNRDFVAFGQTVCLPRNPKCDICPIRGLCERVGLSLRRRS